MDIAALSALRAKLEDECRRIEADVAKLDATERELQSEASGENAYRDHMADQGSATFARELDLTLEENLRDSLRIVHAARDRLAAGTYGECERCGAEISLERLEAIPTTSMCMPCKVAEESR